MLDLARKNAKKASLSNASFIESSITSIPLSDSTVDCIISNCVINLVPAVDKHLVFGEMFRLLKPGGRVAVSDVLAKEELPKEVRDDIALYVGCIAGASQVKEYESWLKDAGFEGISPRKPCPAVFIAIVELTSFHCGLEILILNTNNDLNQYKELLVDDERSDSCAPDSSCTEKKAASCCGSQSVVSCCGSDSMDTSKKHSLDYDMNAHVASYQIYAVKPIHASPNGISTAIQ
jgi:arsenite methyltransferase